MSMHHTYAWFYRSQKGMQDPLDGITDDYDIPQLYFEVLFLYFLSARNQTLVYKNSKWS